MIDDVKPDKDLIIWFHKSIKKRLKNKNVPVIIMKGRLHEDDFTVNGRSRRT